MKKISHNSVLFKLIGILGVVLFFSCKQDSNSPSGIHHIVVIGIDGLSPDGIISAKTPVLDSLMQNGASTLLARSVLPSSSSPNWASMIMGADTEQHGITSNAWEANDYTLPAVVAGNDIRFPTIFTLYHDQKPEAHVGAIYDWDGFGRLYNKKDVNFDINGDHEDGTTWDATAYIEKHKPQFTFVHLDHVDHAGHNDGHGTDSYYRAVEKADKLIGSIIQSTKDAGIFGSTLFIISSDHGGLGKGHGGESLAEINIPFIMYGAGVKKGYTIEETVYQYDNAATVAFAAGLEIPQAWIGRPVKSAFEGQDKPILKYKRKDLIAAPVISPKNGPYAPAGGLYKATEATVILSNPNNTGKIFYTIDGTDPSIKNGKEYIAPFVVDSTTLVRAIISEEGKALSKIASGNYRIISAEKNDGVKFSIFFLKELTALPNYTYLIPAQNGTSLEFTGTVLDSLEQTDNTAVVFKSNLEINTSGDYTFYTTSDDGSKLYVNDKLTVDNDGDHGVQERSGTLHLERGLAKIRLEYFNGGGGYYLDAKYKGPGIGKQIIPANKLLQN